MKEINFDEWEEIEHDEYRDIEEGVEVMWIMFHKGEKHQEGYYFKRKVKR